MASAAYPRAKGRPRQKIRFKDYPLGYLHVDFAEVQIEEGKQYLFGAIDRTNKLTFTELWAQATQNIAVGFLRRVLY